MYFEGTLERRRLEPVLYILRLGVRVCWAPVLFVV